jgi:hypothetical protein
VCYITSSFYSMFSIAVHSLNNRSVNGNYNLYIGRIFRFIS